ncbi:MAG: GNAT family N-acetyltransferase [Candidatus Omnitrophica bacterium]|nr:GNAT family N-acetyltransferase [Candidatus Omnitrophota bacterium]
MIDKLKDKLSSHRRTAITTHVRESNLVAQKFFKAQGFRVEWIERGYYKNSGEDAYWMVYRLPLAEAAPGASAHRLPGAEPAAEPSAESSEQPQAEPLGPGYSLVGDELKESDHRLELHLLDTQQRHLQEIVQIMDSAEKPLGGRGWSEEDFLRYARKEYVSTLVAEYNERVVGFMVYERQVNSVVLIAFGIHPAFRGQRVGRRLIEELKDKLSPRRQISIELLVRESDVESQLFFKGLNFMADKVLRGYFEDTGEDAILMRYSLPAAGPSTPLRAGLEESQAIMFASARERLDGWRSAMENRGVVVVGRSLAQRFLGLQILAGLEEGLVIETDPAQTAILLAERGVTHAHYFGGLEEGNRFAEAAGFLKIQVTAHHSDQPSFLAALQEILLALGVPPQALWAGLEEFSRDLEHLASAA